MTKRERLHPVIVQMRADGKLLREIGAELGLSAKTICEYLNDPTGEKVRARKAKGVRACLDCGGPCNTDGRRTNASKRCKACTERWTRETVLDTLRAFHAEHGRSPREVDAKRGEVGHGLLPNDAVVKYHCGSWNEALVAAGLPLNMDRRAETQEAIEAALRAGESAHDIAARYGVTPHAIWRRMQHRGVSVRDLRRAA